MVFAWSFGNCHSSYYSFVAVEASSAITVYKHSFYSGGGVGNGATPKFAALVAIAGSCGGIDGFSIRILPTIHSGTKKNSSIGRNRGTN